MPDTLTDDGHSAHPTGWCTASAEALSDQNPSQRLVYRESHVQSWAPLYQREDFITRGPFRTPTGDQSGNKPSANLD